MGDGRTKKILALCGGISRDSINRKLLQIVQEQARDKFDIDVFDVASLPYYSQDSEEDLPEAARSLKARILAADGVLFVTPEYNRCFPGVLKNALDWGSRPWGDNSWNGKPAAVIGASIGQIGTALAQRDLRHVLTYLNMPTMMQPEYYLTFTNHAKGDGLDDKATSFLTAFLDAFAEWVSKFSAA